MRTLEVSERPSRFIIIIGTMAIISVLLLALVCCKIGLR